MNYSVIISEDAELDIFTLEAYLAERFYPLNAIRFIDRLTESCYKIGLAPFQGRRRDELGEGIRVKGFERHVAIHFVPHDQIVTILGVAYRGHNPRYLE